MEVWGGTPLSDARRGKHDAVTRLLESTGESEVSAVRVTALGSFGRDGRPDQPAGCAVFFRAARCMGYRSHHPARKTPQRLAAVPVLSLLIALISLLLSRLLSLGPRPVFSPCIFGLTLWSVSVACFCGNRLQVAAAGWPDPVAKLVIG